MTGYGLKKQQLLDQGPLVLQLERSRSGEHTSGSGRAFHWTIGSLKMNVRILSGYLKLTSMTCF